MLTKLALNCLRDYRLHRLSTRQLSTSQRLGSARDLEKLRRTQALFQCEDGTPVFLKRGIMDRILYSTTLVLCLVGLFNTLKVIYNQAKPPSWKTEC